MNRERGAYAVVALIVAVAVIISFRHTQAKPAAASHPGAATGSPSASVSPGTPVPHVSNGAASSGNHAVTPGSPNGSHTIVTVAPSNEQVVATSMPADVSNQLLPFLASYYTIPLNDSTAVRTASINATLSRESLRNLLGQKPVTLDYNVPGSSVVAKSVVLRDRVFVSRVANGLKVEATVLQTITDTTSYVTVIVTANTTTMWSIAANGHWNMTAFYHSEQE